MGVWSAAITAAGKGATAGTPETVGTITIDKANVKEILGLEVLAIPTNQAADIAARPIIILNSNDLGFVDEEFQISKQAIADPVATNNGPKNVFAEFIPLKSRVPPKLNSKLTVKIDTTVDITGGYDVAVGLVFTDGVKTETQIALAMGSHVRCQGGKGVSGTASTTSATSLGTISVPSTAEELVAIIASSEIQDETAGESIVGYVELISNSIDNFAPQQWVLGNGWVPSLGTPVEGAGVAASRIWATEFPLPSINFDISVSVKLAVALTNASRFNVALRWR